jgi:transcriptional regulator with XRE-family HTH domain
MSCQRCHRLVCQCPFPKVVYSDGNTADEMRDLIRAKARESTQKALAKQCGISEQYLSDVLLGRREPAEKLLEAVGFRRVVTYRPISQGPSPTVPVEEYRRVVARCIEHGAKLALRDAGAAGPLGDPDVLAG